MSYLVANNVTQIVEGRSILQHVDVEIHKGKIYSILGPNGCGKSTLLKTLGRQMQPQKGFIQLQGQNVYSLSQKEMAKQLSYLQQHSQQVDITARQLISYGRTPHKSMFQRLTDEDEAIIDWAIEQTHVGHLADRSIFTLSGGEAQRVWIAMALTQQTDLLFLDEPTNHLDISHQIDLLELVKRLNKDLGVTVVMVLHDLNFAASYSDEIIVLKDGAVYAKGLPQQVMTDTMFREVFAIGVQTFYDEQDNTHFFRLKGRAI